ncbi:MAG TPA: hypothetical protein DCG75_05080 [Bacteroidales bacterium]|nr:hypothetical protein [Bacteroidales bacterium]
MKLGLLIIILFIVKQSFSQTDSSFVKQKEVIVIENKSSNIYSYHSIEIKPLFDKTTCSEKSELELRKYFEKKVKQLKVTEKGEVYLNLVIGEDGIIKDFKILTSDNEALNEHAVTIIKNLPPWKPGVHNGNKVEVSYNTVIKFE